MFLPAFNLSILNVNLKSGILGGVAIISSFSSAVTVYSHWAEIKQKTETITNFINTSYITPLLTKAQNSLNSLKQGLSEWNDKFTTKLQSLKDWFQNATWQKYQENLIKLFEYVGESIQKAYDTISNFSNLSSIDLTPFQQFISNISPFFQMYKTLVSSLLSGELDFSKLSEAITQIAGNEKATEIFAQMGKLGANYSNILPQITGSELLKLFNFAGTKSDAFLKNAKNLLDNKSSFSGKGKDEIIKELMKDTLLAMIGSLIVNVLDSVTECESGSESCSKDTIISDIFGTTIGSWFGS